MRPALQLILTDSDSGQAFTFSDVEIPRSIAFGGEQRTTRHNLVGGARVIDAMGRSDHDLEWSGYFLSNTAVDRARYLDSVRIAGAQQNLSWGAFSYIVVLKEFKADFRRPWEIPYHVLFEVVADLTTPQSTVVSPNADQAIAADMATVNGLTSQIGDPTLTANVASLNSAVVAVPTFASAPQSTLSSVLGPVSIVMSRVAVLIAANDGRLSGAGGFGGVVAGATALNIAASLTAQSGVAGNQLALLQLQAAAGRLDNNLDSIGSGGTLTVAGGNLFQIAESQYGDASAWTGIAKANGLTDPQIVGTQTLVIPPTADPSGGVLTA